jgi:sterol desaturase/sphingolipid hydroxylase (fatty acid hydroxylase superfamily)
MPGIVTIAAYSATALLFAGVVAVLMRAETAFPVEADQSRQEVFLDYRMVALNVLPNLLLSPLLSGCGTAIVNAMGGGRIELRVDGWWYLLSLLIFVLATELFAYGVHRAQHAIPFLWAMHSLHHSAEALTLVTGARHYWFEQMVITAFFPVVAIIFKVPAEVVTTAAFFYFLFDGCVHLNIRLRFGPLALCINNPQYHRIHHSVQPEHQNKNFCKLLPIIDVAFGTAWRPSSDEFPPTGLTPREKPTGWIDGIFWPLRRRLSPASELPPTRSAA